MPQALLFLILMLMLTMLFLNIMLFTLAPQYVMYGSQHYMKVSYKQTLVNTPDTSWDNTIHKVLVQPTKKGWAVYLSTTSPLRPGVYSGPGV